jgi:hypothetical protein
VTNPCFFLPFWIEHSLWDVITGHSDNSSKDVAANEHAGQSAVSSARQTRSHHSVL